MQLHSYKRLFIVFLLGFSSGLPFALLGSTLQAWYLDAGLTLTQVGWLSLLGLPYAYRVFFAPCVEYVPYFHMGKRRSWMLLTQLVLLCGLNGLAWCNPYVSPLMMSGFALVLSMCSAMQDVVVDAQRIEYLPEAEHGLGASYGMLGYHIAMLVGGGGTFVLAHYIGWPWSYRFMGLGMMLGLIATYWSEEPRPSSMHHQERGFDLWKAPFKALLERPYWISLCLFIFCYKLNDAFTSTSSGVVIPFFKQALDFSNETIGYVYKSSGVLAWILGSLWAGYGLKKWSLYKTLLYGGMVHAFTTLLWIFMNKTLWVLMSVVWISSFMSGFTTVALITLLMRMTDRRYTATQFALLVAISVLPRCCSGPLGAWIQSYVGWVGLYEWVSFMSFLFIPFLYCLRHVCSDEINVNRPVHVA